MPNEHTPCPACGNRQSLINGRTLKDLLGNARESHPWKNRKIKVTQWVAFCSACDRQKMLDAGAGDVPFLANDGAMHTLTEFRGSEILRMGSMRMTRTALEASIASLNEVDSTTKTVEALGLDYLSSPNPIKALAFSEAVCTWGRGQRVFANLKRHHGPALAGIMHHWLSQVESLSDQEAIQTGTDFKGLGVSFASKHLRMLIPQRFGVLDEVLSMGLGYAMNTAGFAFFMMDLRELKDKHGIRASLGQIEAGVFLMARQLVRSD
jgi:hypothetical protein